MIADYASSSEHLKAGKLRAIANASPTRLEALPDLPTVAESGQKEFEVDLWWALYAPAKTPKRFSVSPAGSAQHYRYPRSRKSSPSKGSIRPEYAARNLVL